MSDVNVLVGYKNTEIGTIPEDWEVVELGNQSKQISSGRNTKDKNGIYPLYGSTGLIGRCTDYSYNQQAILVARVGANAGLVNLADGKYGVSDNTIIIDLNDNNNIHFIKFWLIKKDLNTLVFGSGQPLITGTQLKKLLIVKPPKREQTAIATALSDVDNLIQSLERLVSKKEAIKTATMQQLLTGKTRLPEFSIREDGSKKGFKQTDLGEVPEDWDYKALSEMTENKGLVRGPFGGALKKDSFVRTGFKVYEQRNAIYANTEIGKYYINKDKFNELQRFTVKPKDFIVSCSGTIGRIYQIPLNAPEGIINQALLKITLNKNTDEQFFYQIFNSKEFQESITDSTQGGAMKNLIGMSEFKKSIMLMPPKLEQTAISTIFSDMDAEIQALRDRLTKTQDIKQGMMQQLLTGKVRLVSPSNEKNNHVSTDKGNH